jgi:hypothetical protein
MSGANEPSGRVCNRHQHLSELSMSVIDVLAAIPVDDPSGNAITSAQAVAS